MDTNKFFSFSRIAMVMKREIMENWKTNLYSDRNLCCICIGNGAHNVETGDV